MADLIFEKKIKEAGMSLSVGFWHISDFQVINSAYNFEPVFSEIEAEIRKNFTLDTIKEHPIIAAYRSFYWKYQHIDPTKTRPASEALIRRILGNKPLPVISPFVDAYNWASVSSLISLGAYDYNEIALPIIIRFSREKEKIHLIGKGELEVPSNILVTADAKDKILCQYPYRDSAQTMVTDQTHSIVVLAYGVNQIPDSTLLKALEETKHNLDWLQTHGIIKYHPGNPMIYTN
jgi:DNA/RNA-binding domain of Phe-tRNA-synthetase-like protein